jgi:predicted nucleic acid-binding Zn ribbon protein
VAEEEGRPTAGDQDRLSLAQDALAAARARAQAKGLRPTGPRPRQPGPGQPAPVQPGPGQPAPGQPGSPQPVETGRPPVDGQRQAVADDTSLGQDFVPPQGVHGGGDGAGGSSAKSVRQGRPRSSEPVKRVRRDDPQPLDAAIKGLLDTEGWNMAVATGSVFGRWAQIVGPELADHTQPEALRDGELIVVADSTAWATQLRLLAAQLVRRLNAELGPGAVQRVKVRGPVTAARRPGEWRVRGSRGPRDTYG